MKRSKRREINRQNAQKSTGPKTEEGKERSRQNALKHGLRAEILALPNEDPAEIQARADAWNDYYKPRTPAEQHMVDECVRATILADRCHRYHEAALAKQIRDTKMRWEWDREDEVERLKNMLPDDPATAVRELGRTSHGCRYLLERWKELGRSLRENRVWLPIQRDEAVRLLGERPEPEYFLEGRHSHFVRLTNVLCYDQPNESVVKSLLDRKQMPADSPFEPGKPLPDPEAARAQLQRLVDLQMAHLAEREEFLHVEIDDADQSQATERALVLLDERSARLFLRYQAEIRSGFHRPYQLLMKSLASDPYEPPDDAADSTGVSPNEANPAEVSAATQGDAPASGDSQAPAAVSDAPPQEDSWVAKLLETALQETGGLRPGEVTVFKLGALPGERENLGEMGGDISER